MDDFSKENMPFSMIGLEPGWQSHAYSCSFDWNRENFPNPDHLIQKSSDHKMHINLWEQAYVHPTSESYNSLVPYSGDYEVWGGLAPDFPLPEVQEIYGEIQG